MQYALSYFLFIDLTITKQPVQPVRPRKNSTQLNLNEIPPQFIHEIKTNGYEVISIHVFLPKKEG